MPSTPVFLYMRCSTKKQMESLPGQKKDCERFAKHNNYEIIETFEDYGQSGYSKGRGKRKGYDALFTACETGRAKHILVFDLSRFTRQEFIEAFSDVMDLHKLGVTIIDIKGSEYDLRTDFGPHYLIMNLQKNWKESEDKGFLLRQRIAIKREQGWCHGVPPLGYMREKEPNGTVWVPDPETKEIVIELFKLYDKNKMNPSQLARWLNDDVGLLTQRGNLFKPIGVGNILRNPAYGGYHVHKNDWDNLQKAKITTFIPKKLWERVYEKAHKIRRGEKHTIRKNPLSGIVVCSKCGTTAHVYQGTGGYKYAFYRCHATRLGGCDCKFKVRVVNLEKMVFEHYLKILEKDGVRKITSRVVKIALANLKEETKAAQPLLDEVEERERNIQNLTAQAMRNPDVEYIGVMMDKEQKMLDLAKASLRELDSPLRMPSKKELELLISDNISSISDLGDLVTNINKITIIKEGMVEIEMFGAKSKLMIPKEVSAEDVEKLKNQGF